MSQEIAYLEAVVGADVTSFRRAMAQVRSDLFDIGGLSQSLRHIGANLTYAITAPIIGGMGAAVYAASQFEEAMRNVASISPLVADNFANISQEVQEMGSNSTFGATQMAEALYMIQSAGFGLNNISDALLVTQQSSDLAEAGMSDLSVTANALVAVMNAYGASAQEAGYYSDVIANTVALGVGSMDGLIHSMAQVLPATLGLGLEFDDLGSSLAFLTQRSFSWATASTSLNNLFTKLITPTEAMSGVFREIGVNSGQELIDTFGGIGGALQEIYNIVGTDENRLHELFPDIRGFRAALTIFENFGDYTDLLAEFDATMEGATGRQREQQLQSFNAAIHEAGAAIEGMGISIGNALIPVLRPLVVDFTNLANSVAEANPALIQLGVAFGVVVAAMPPLVYLVGTLLTPIGAFVAAVTGIGALFVTNFDSIRAWADTNAPEVVSAIESVISSISDLITAATTPVPTSVVSNVVYDEEGFGQLGVPTTTYSTPTFATAWQRLGQSIIDTISQAVRDVVAWVETDGVALFDSVASSVFNAIGDAFSGTSTATRGVGAQDTWVSQLVSGFPDAVSGAGEGVGNLFPQMSEAINNLLTNFGEWLSNEGIPTAAYVAGAVVGAIGAALVTVIKAVFSGAKTVDGVSAEQIRMSFETGLNDMLMQLDITEAGEELAARVVGVLAAAFLVLNITGIGAGSIALPLAGIIIGGLKKVVGVIITAFAPAITGFWNSFVLALSNLLTGAGGVSAAVLGVLGAAIGGVIAGLSIWSVLPEDIKSALSDFVRNIFAELLAAITSADVTDITDNLDIILEGAILQPLASVMDALGLDSSGVRARLQELADEYNGIVANTFRGITAEDLGFAGEAFTMGGAQIPSFGFNDLLDNYQQPTTEEATNLLFGTALEGLAPTAAPSFKAVADEADKAGKLAVEHIETATKNINTDLIIMGKDTTTQMVGFNKSLTTGTAIALEGFTTFKNNFNSVVAEMITQLQNLSNEAMNALTNMNNVANLPPVNTGGGSGGTGATGTGSGAANTGDTGGANVYIYTNSPQRVAREMQRTGVITGVGLTQL